MQSRTRGSLRPLGTKSNGLADFFRRSTARTLYLFARSAARTPHIQSEQMMVWRYSRHIYNVSASGQSSKCSRQRGIRKAVLGFLRIRLIHIELFDKWNLSLRQTESFKCSKKFEIIMLTIQFQYFIYLFLNIFESIFFFPIYISFRWQITLTHRFFIFAQINFMWNYFIILPFIKFPSNAI